MHLHSFIYIIYIYYIRVVMDKDRHLTCPAINDLILISTDMLLHEHITNISTANNHHSNNNSSYKKSSSSNHIKNKNNNAKCYQKNNMIVPKSILGTTIFDRF